MNASDKKYISFPKRFLGLLFVVLLLFSYAFPVSADTDYMDPNADGTIDGNWSYTGGSAYYDSIDDQTRAPNSPDTTDYISIDSNKAGSPAYFRMSEISNVATATQITVWIYEYNGSNGEFQGALYNDDESTEYGAEKTFPRGSDVWASTTWSGLSLSSSQLASTTVMLDIASTGGAPVTNHIYAMYAEVTYESANAAPSQPANPFPANGSTSVSQTTNLEVDVSDDDGDSLNVTFYNASNDSEIGSATATDTTSTTTATTSWSDLSASTTYSWYAVADDGIDQSTSSTWEFTTQKPPQAPTNPYPPDGTTDIVASTSLSVDVYDPEGDAMTVYFYDSSDGSLINSTSVAATDPAATSTATTSWSGLNYDNTYSWYAVAHDGQASSTDSNTWSFETDKSPDAPTSLTQYESDCTTKIATSSWTNQTEVCLEGEITDPDGADQVKLQVDYATSGESFDSSIDSASGWCSATCTPTTSLSGLTSGTQYKWQARSIDDKDATSSFSQYDGDIAFGVDTENPTSSVDSLSDWQASTSWSVSWSGADSISSVEHYDIQYEKNGAGWTDCLVDDASTSITFPEGCTASSPTATSGDSFKFRSRAQDVAGNQESYPALADASTTIDTSAPLVSIDSPATSSWHKADFDVGYTDSDSGSGIDSCHYKIEDAGATSKSWDTRTCNGTTTIDISQYCATEGVDKCTVFTYNVNNSGISSATTSRSFSIDVSSPADLGSLSILKNSPKKMSLDWEQATDTNFSHYEIWYGTSSTAVENRNSPASEWDHNDDSDLSSASTNKTTITGLTPATNYYFKIWAVDDLGQETTIGKTSGSSASLGKKKIWQLDALKAEGLELGL